MGDKINQRGTIPISMFARPLYGNLPRRPNLMIARNPSGLFSEHAVPEYGRPLPIMETLLQRKQIPFGEYYFFKITSKTGSHTPVTTESQQVDTKLGYTQATRKELDKVKEELERVREVHYHR